MARSTGRVLLCHRVKDDLWGVPGGHVERGESRRRAALRELSEETGYEGELSELQRVRSSERFVLYFALVPSEFSPVLNEEHDRCGWFDIEGHPQSLHQGLGGVLEVG
jgi:nucleoside triphosphatase